MDPTRRKGPGATTESGRQGKALDLDGPLSKQREDPTTTDTQGGPRTSRTLVDPSAQPRSRLLPRGPCPITQETTGNSHSREATPLSPAVQPFICLSAQQGLASLAECLREQAGSCCACPSTPVACEFQMGADRAVRGVGAGTPGGGKGLRVPPLRHSTGEKPCACTNAHACTHNAEVFVMDAGPGETLP